MPVGHALHPVELVRQVRHQRLRGGGDGGGEGGYPAVDLPAQRGHRAYREQFIPHPEQLLEELLRIVFGLVEHHPLLEQARLCLLYTSPSPRDRS